jgi:hypothetical protein
MISILPDLRRRDSCPVVHLQGYDQRNSGMVIDHELDVLEELSINLRCQCVFCRCEDQLAAVLANTGSSGNQSGVGCTSIGYLFEREQASAATRATSDSVGHTLEFRGPSNRMYLYRSLMGSGIFQVGYCEPTPSARSLLLHQLLCHCYLREQSQLFLLCLREGSIPDEYSPCLNRPAIMIHGCLQIRNSYVCE